jgi:hypothetical protein
MKIPASRGDRLVSGLRRPSASHRLQALAWGVEVPSRDHRVRRTADPPTSLGFWCSLLVEIIGGLVTALALGVGAAIFAASQQVRSHDERIADLFEDNRRWFRDRDRRVAIEKARAVGPLNAQGLLYSGAWIQAMAIKQQDALHDYRDEMSAKRRRYRELRDPEGKAHELVRRRRSKPMRRFELTDEERSVLALVAGQHQACAHARRGPSHRGPDQRGVRARPAPLRARGRPATGTLAVGPSLAPWPPEEGGSSSSAPCACPGRHALNDARAERRLDTHPYPCG